MKDEIESIPQEPDACETRTHYDHQLMVKTLENPLRRTVIKSIGSLGIFSHKNFLILNKCVYVVKIKNKRKLKVYLKDYDSGIISQELAAKYLGITPRRFRQIHKIYRSTGSIPAIGVNLGRPKKEIPEDWKEIIKEEYEKFRQNACLPRPIFPTV